MTLKKYRLILLLLGAASCTHPIPPLFQELPAEQTGVHFENIPASRDSLNILDYLYYYNGGGVAIGDINNDGLPDLYFTANNKGGNRLYLNRGHFHFEDITDIAGVRGNADWCTGVTMADVNGDGYLDIYVCAVSGKLGLKGSNQLFINQGNGRFTESAAAYGLDFSGFSTQASFFDYDHDGDLDCFLLNQSSHSVETYGDTSLRRIPNALAGDQLFRNDAGHFTNVTAGSGIYTSALGYGLGLAVADLNNDGWDDIYVGNDFHENDYYYLNDHHGHFTECGARHFGHYSRFSMGNDIADYNNDGQPDIVTADMLPAEEKVLKTYGGGEQPDVYRYAILDNGFQPQYSRNCLQTNLGNGEAFSEQALMAGVAATDWSWSPLLADYDNDGIKDLFISNGIVKRPVDLDYMRFISSSLVTREMSRSNRLDSEALAKMPDGKVHNYIFRGGKNARFEDHSKDWGMSAAGWSNGAAYADLDNDGRLDLVVNNLYGPAGIYRNGGQPGKPKKFLTISCNGDGHNRFGIGAKVYLFHKGMLQYQQLMLTRGFESATEPRLHFGLDTLSSIDSLLVVWPDQTAQLLRDVPTGRAITLDKKNAGFPFVYTNFFPPPKPLLVNVTDSIGLPWRHRENPFYDFSKQYFIPHQLSTAGPRIAAADVNGDGLDDLYLCGAKDQGGALYLQTRDGHFQSADTALFAGDRGDDQTDALFFDCNGDGHPDLLVVHGGNEETGDAAGLQDRLYINDGKGHFSPAMAGSLPILNGNRSVVCTADIDHDGDQDLFIGIRADADTYGLPQTSYLLLNDGKGRFTLAGAAPFSNAGMISAAAFADLNKDGWPDLVVLGEWMSPTIFINHQGIFRRGEQPLPTGLWQSLLLADADGDGNIDILAGNYGLNSKLHASPAAPLKCYLKDFTGYHTLHQLLTYTTPEGEFTFLGKDELEKKLPWIKKKFLRYADFAGRTVSDVFGDALQDARLLMAENLASCLFKNDGNGHFTTTILPDAAQVSPVFAMLADDLGQVPASNGTGKKYLLTGGNFNGALPYEGNYDANWGNILAPGDTAYLPLSPVTSGFLLRGEVRDIKKIRTKKGYCYIVARNNAPLLFFRPA